MKSFIALSFGICSIITSMSAQSLNGEYRLRGIPEVASAFRFTTEGKFDYFFIYGAVDRAATGSYTMNGDTVILKSDKEPGMDFPVQKQSHQGKNYTIRVTAPDKYLLSHIVCLYHIGDSEKVAYSNNDGVIEIEEPNVDKIYLIHELFPDVPSLIKDESNNNNQFEVALSPSLVQVSFKGIDLFLNDDTLTCLPNYIMPFENIRFVKE